MIVCREMTSCSLSEVDFVKSRFLGETFVCHVVGDRPLNRVQTIPNSLVPPVGLARFI